MMMMTLDWCGCGFRKPMYMFPVWLWVCPFWFWGGCGSERRWAVWSWDRFPVTWRHTMDDCYVQVSCLLSDKKLKNESIVRTSFRNEIKLGKFMNFLFHSTYLNVSICLWVACSFICPISLSSYFLSVIDWLLLSLSNKFYFIFYHEL
jgi:hypothetical protein